MRRISTRLAVAFLIAALLPAIPLSLVVHDLLERRFGPSLAVPLEEALEAGLAESRRSLHREKQALQDRAEQIAAAAPAAAPPAATGTPDLTGKTVADRRPAPAHSGVARQRRGHRTCRT
jgi:nitrogen fixation/metabolism regulation signal transduction histidine kinase